MGLFRKMKQDYEDAQVKLKPEQDARWAKLKTDRDERSAKDKADRDERNARIKAQRDKRADERKAEYEEGKAKRAENRAKIKAQRNEQKAEKQAAKAAVQDARGKELGYISISYVGGFDDKRRFNAKLHLFEKRIEYSQLGKLVEGLMIPTMDVMSLEITGQQQTNSRLSVTRMATLGVFSLAAPKRTKVKDTNVIIGLKDGRQVFFHTKNYTEFEVHSKLANAISYYKSLQVAQANQQQVEQQTPTDNAGEIMKYATLYKRGAITEAEYQAKKRQLLGL